MKIGIDGPAGSGKTTVARLIAKRLGISYLDTGATYRTLTLEALNKKIDLTDKIALGDLASSLDLRIEEGKIYLRGEDVSEKIRTPLIDKNISAIVSYPEVRKVMVGLQRKVTKEGDFVIEGRDITTVVFPDAEYKFYLDADPKVRAKRRYKELKEKGLRVDFDETEKDLIRRDKADKNRKVSPLRISDDAVVIDTTRLTIEQTVDEVIKHIPSYQGQN